MFWNCEFLDSTPSQIDVLLQMQTVKLSDILFEEDLLQELKTSNVGLTNFLSRPEIISELVNNITQLTEKDCCDKLLYSRVHIAYISCEILTVGTTEIFAAFVNHPESLSKIISCLTVEPKNNEKSVTSPFEEKDEPNKIETKTEEGTNVAESTDGAEGTKVSDETEVAEATNVNEETKVAEETNVAETNNGTEETKVTEVTNAAEETKVAEKTEVTEETIDAEETKVAEPTAETTAASKSQSPCSTTKTPDESEDVRLAAEEYITMTKVVPQKATLISKIISSIHTIAAANLSCHITRDIGSFEKLINLLVQNIDVSGAFDILSTFIKRTEPPELRYVFCEILSKLNFVYKLIDVMTLSDVEDKQRNACHLLCDIIVIGRQDASEQTDSGPMAQDMLAELLESTQAVHVILKQMFSENMRNCTAVVCGMKVLQTMLEKKSTSDEQLLTKTIEQTQEEIEKHLIKFHELLLNPPKQEPIKTTFGIIQKPLGYMRLEVVNLIRALISTNSPNIIRKIVNLRTMKVIIDLFIEYYWNNLLHTQVEQALCLIINNCRRDEELNYQIDMQQHSHLNDNQIAIQLSTTTTTTTNECQPEGPGLGDNKVVAEQQAQPEQSAMEFPSRALLSQMLNECDLIGRLLLPTSMTSGGSSNISRTNVNSSSHNNNEINNEQHDGPSEQNNQDCKNDNSSSPESNNEAKIRIQNNSCPPPKPEQTNDRMRQAELDRQRRRNGEQANFGHIIQMINSIAINRDLDTIRDHLNEMKERRQELHDRWTTFVNVDVASFKEISLYYDAQSANNNVNYRYGHTPLNQIGNNQHLLTSDSSHLDSSSTDHNNISGTGSADELMCAYRGFTREIVIPAINVDVLPQLRRSKNAH